MIIYQTIEQTLTSKKKDELTNYVNITLKTIESYYNRLNTNKDKTENEIKKMALDTVSHVRYGKNGYFWINDFQSNMIMHPVKKELIGKNFKNNSKVPFIDLGVEKLKSTSEKSAFIKYSFTNPTTNKTANKISNVTIFKPWGWIIGTGAYVDDIEENIQMMQAKADEEITSIIFGILATAIILSLIIIALVSFVSTKYIINPMRNFEEGLLNFFKYLNRERTEVSLLDEDSADEIGTMAKVVNQNILKTKMSIEEDRETIDETIKILSEFEQGDLCQRVHSKTSNPALKELTTLLNQMGSNIETNIDQVLDVLEEYSNSNYMNKVKTAGIKKHLFKLANGVNTLGDSITEMLIENKQNGITLGLSSDTLLHNVDTLNKNSNESASALEQTAASLEEMTSNISSNTENVVKMSGFASSLSKSANEGEELANTNNNSHE